MNIKTGSEYVSKIYDGKWIKNLYSDKLCEDKSERRFTDIHALHLRFELLLQQSSRFRYYNKPNTTEKTVSMTGDIRSRRQTQQHISIHILIYSVFKWNCLNWIQSIQQKKESHFPVSVFSSLCVLLFFHLSYRSLLLVGVRCTSMDTCSSQCYRWFLFFMLGIFIPRRRILLSFYQFSCSLRKFVEHYGYEEAHSCMYMRLSFGKALNLRNYRIHLSFVYVSSTQSENDFSSI